MEFRVLIPIDDDVDRAVAQARTVRRFPGADGDIRATVLHVYPGGEPNDTNGIADLPSGAAALKELEEGGISVETKISVGDPPESILTVAEEMGADQIVMGGRKRSPLGSVLFGSISQAVVLDADRPVTITGNTPPEEPTYICATCGQRYYSGERSGMKTCHACGGTQVELVE